MWHEADSRPMFTDGFPFLFYSGTYIVLFFCGIFLHGAFRLTPYSQVTSTWQMLIGSDGCTKTRSFADREVRIRRRSRQVARRRSLQVACWIAQHVVPPGAPIYGGKTRFTPAFSHCSKSK
jgi:hypothetical protein